RPSQQARTRAHPRRAHLRPHARGDRLRARSTPPSPRPHQRSLILCTAGAVAFGILAARFIVTLRHEGVTSRAGTDRHGGHHGYTLHHLIACAAMIYLFLTAPITGGPGAFSADTPAVQPGATSLTGVNWLFGMYFLVAATSLGFRVAEPAVR